MAASDYVPIFFNKPLASRGASTDEYTPQFNLANLQLTKAFSSLHPGMPRLPS